MLFVEVMVRDRSVVIGSLFLFVVVFCVVSWTNRRQKAFCVTGSSLLLKIDNTGLPL